MALSNFDTKIMKVVLATHHQVISDIECRGVYNVHACHLCQFPDII